MSPRRVPGIPSRYYVRILFVLVVLGVGLAIAIGISNGEESHAENARAIARIDREGRRARRAECQVFNRSVNASVAKIRLAVIQVAGYQAPIVSGASPDLVAQIQSSNLRRRAFAEEQAKTIPDISVNCSKIGNGKFPVGSLNSTPSATTTTTTGGTP